MKLHKCCDCCQFKDGKCKEWKRTTSKDNPACKLAYWNGFFKEENKNAND